MRFGKSPTSAGVLLLALVVYSAAVCEKTAFAAPSADTSDIFVAPMLGANWAQGSPMNDLTPRRSPCGCSATAGGQELRLWRWPYRFEKSRTFAHQYFDDDGNWTTYTIRLDGRVPLDWDKIAASGGASTPVASDKGTAYNTAMLTAWLQSFAKISFKPGAGSANQKICSEAENWWYEAGPVMSRHRNGYDNLWTAITNDLAFGSPVQINTPVHQMVIDGYAVDNAGTANETRWINTNYGWGGAICWENFDTATTSGGSAGVFADFQTGYRPQKRVQFESVPRVSATSVPLVWHLAPCYTNKIDGFTLEIAKFAGETQFADDFSNSTGVASGEKFKVENGVLGGYPAIQTSYFTYPETYMATDDSVLEFDVQSRYMSGHAATAEICADGGAWETAATIPLSAGKNVAFGTPTHQTVSLASFAGRTIRLRFKLACTWAGYAAGSSPDFIIDNVSLSGVTGFAETETVEIERDDTTPGVYGYTASELEDGANYAFTVTPVMTDGSAARSNAATTRIGTPEPAPEILGVSSVACGLELVQDGFFIECARGMVNDIDVDCNAATVDLVALPSHLSILPDEKISVEGESGVFTVHVDATEMAETGKFHDGDMLILTLVATNADGTEAAKNLMLRFNSMRQVMDGTFDVIDSDAATPVWFCGNTTIDAKGQTVVFASGAFQGTGNVTLTDSTSGGSLAFESLDGFTGTLTFDDGVSVSLPTDMTAFAGKISNNVALESGETMKIAGMTPFAGGITLAGGTLKIALSDEDVAYGFSTSEISYITGSVVFVAPDGTETAAVQEDSTFSFEGTANVWTPKKTMDDFWQDYTPNYYADTSLWSKGVLPSDGDYVVFNVPFDAPMMLNISSAVALSGIKVVGAGELYIDTYGATKLNAAKFINSAAVEVATTQLAPGTVAPEANLVIAKGTKISCEVDSSCADYLKTYYGQTTLRSLLQYSDMWNGTVVFENYTAEGLSPGAYGNKQSTVRFKGVTGWLVTNKEFDPAVELVDNGDTPALHWNNGSSSTMATFKALKGTGTFKTSKSSVTDKVLIKDVSAFAGSFNLAAKAVAIADSMPTENLAYTGRLLVNKAATIASGATWTANGGVYLGACELTVAGTLASPLTASAAGAKLTLADGGTIVASAAIAGDYSPSLDFKAGTYKIDADVRETNTVNFCAAEGDVTTLDANGHKMTLAESFFSGSGDITLVSSVAGGSFEIEGVSQDFTGTIRLDGEVNVSLPDDLSSIGGTIAISGASLAYSSAKLGPLSVGVGSTLTVSLTDSEAMKGFSASSVTLDGGTIEFVDQYGTTVGSSTESTTYVKPDGYTLAPVPTAVWVSGEFEDEATLHGGYAIALNDNTVNDSGNIVIGSATTIGAVIDTAAGDFTNATVLVKYTIPSGGAPAENAVPAGFFNTKDFGALASKGSSDLRGYWLDGSTLKPDGFAFSSPAPSMPESGYLLISTWALKPNPGDHGTAVYTGATIASLAGGEKTGLRFTDTNNRVTKIAIGGPTTAKAVPWSGMIIEAVAVFGNSWLVPSDVALYEFPEAKEYVPTWAKASVTPTNGKTVYYTDVLAALSAVANGQVDGKVVKVYDGTSTDYSDAGFTYDPETQTYTLVATAIARVGNGIVEVEFATLAEACQYAEEEGFGSVTLLAATSETIPSGWSYVSPADSGTTYGELLKIVSEIPGTTSRIALTQENVSLSADGEWAEVGTNPIYVTLGSETNSFTLSFDADIPDGVYGTLLSWDSVLGTTRVDSRVVITNDAAKQVIWRKADGTLSTVEYTTSKLIPSGEHYIELNWVHNSGATIKVDGEPYYESDSLKFTNYLTSRLALGGSALGSPDDVLAGLKVKNLNFRVGKQPTEPDEENEDFPRYNYVTRLDGTVYHGNDENRAIITNWQSQLIHPATRPVPAGKTDAEFDTIDVLFVYDTPGKASVEAGDTEEWNGFSKLEVFSAKATARMNQILCTTDMDTNFWFRMVGVHTVDGTGGTIANILGKCEGLRDEYKYMLELRDRYGADVIVTPTTQSGGYGGLARLNTLDEIKSRGQNAAYHFASVLLGYSQTHAWVHEIGHNMSLNHYPPANFDPANTWRGLGFQHKIAVDGTPMSSVMAEQGYADFCGGFSSKNHIYHGSRLSISNHLDSTGVLLEAAPYVSQWRSTRVPETQEIKCSVTYGSSLPGDTEFALSYPDPEVEIWYHVYGLNNDFVKYTEPFTVPESAGSAYISAYVVKDGVSSATNVVNFSAFNSTWDTLLGSPKLPWAIYKSINGGWAAASGEEYLEVADSFTGSSTSESTLSTTVVGPDTLSFEHSELLKDNPYRGSWPHTFADSSFTVWVDNEPVYMLRGATNTLEKWTTTDIAIPEGTHKVDFIYSHRSGYVSGETVRIKSVALASAQEPEDPPVDPDSYAIEPLAVWYKDFKTAEKGGYTLSTSGTTAIANDTYGSTLTIGNAAAVIDTSAANTNELTVLVKYTAAPNVTSAPVVAFGGMAGDGTVGLDVGAYTKADKTLAVYRNFNTDNGKPYEFASAPVLSATGGYLLCARDNVQGFRAYVGESLDSMTGETLSSATIKFSNVPLTKIGIGGGSTLPANANDMVPFTGFVVEKIAVFKGYYTPRDLIPLETPEDAATLSIADNATWNFAAGATRTYESIGALSSSGTIAVTNDTVGVGVYKLAEWTTPQQYKTTCAGYGRVGTLSVPGLANGLVAELVYGANAIYLRVYDETAQFLKPTLSIMPYGDSITEGFNAQHTGANYRILLYQKLRMLGYNVRSCGVYGLDDGYDSVDPSGEPLGDVDRWHSAKHGAVAGRSTVTASGRSDLEENVDTLAAAAGKPDFVLLHIGINDLVSSDRNPTTVCQSVTNIAWRLVNDLPDTKIVLSTVLNVTGSQKNRTFNGVALPDLVAQFNNLLAERIAGFPEGRVYLADLNGYVKSDDPGVIYSDGIHPDWRGFDQMAEGWLSVITNVYSTANGPFPSNEYADYVDDSALGAAAKTELADYIDGFTLAQTITVASTNAPTVVSGEGPATGIGKVGYFVEYVRADNETHKWVWVDMDAPATTLEDLGLPTANRQQVVTSLHVKSNHNGIDDIAPDDDSATGFIEFSPYKGTGAASGIGGAPAAYGSAYGWNDTLGTSGDYGCMQIHRVVSTSSAPGGQVLFAYNNWNAADSAAEFGIGNFSQHFHAGTQTFDYMDTRNLEKMNASAYRVKRIEIWTKEANVRRIAVAEGETATVDDYQPGVTYIISGAGTVTFTQLPAASSLSFEDWTGTLELPAFRAGGQVLTDYVVNGVSKLKLNGITGGYLMWNDLDFQSELVLAGDFVLTDMSARDYSFAKISGTGNISLSPGTYELKSFVIGEYSASGIVSNSMSATAIAIGTLALPEGTSVVGGTRLLATGGTGAVSVENVTVGGVAQSISLVNGGEGDEAGLYVESSSATATVVRVHPRLTRGLAREALLGIRFDNALGGNVSAFDVKFRLVNCTKADITDIKYWRQPYTHNYGFYEAEAMQGPTATVTAADDATEFTASFPAGSVWFYPQVGTREDSDYLWVTATINPEISPDAEIWVSVPTAKITLTNGGVFDVVNGEETQPHRVFPFVHQVGAYLRQDSAALTGESAGKLEDATADRVGNLTDIVVCNDFLVAYDSENDTFKTTWDARGRDNTAQVARIKELRDQYNPKCMIRGSLTKGEGTITVDGVTGRPIACAAASAARRKQLIDSILAVMESAGLDGLDIDWEYPGDHAVTEANKKRDWHSYGLLMRDLAAAFFDKGYILSFCSNLGYQMAPDGYHAAFHAADFVNAMAYGASPLNASPRVMMTGINVCTSRGVPQRRIVVGQAMYAYEVQNPGWGSVVPWLKEAWPNDNTRWWDADLVWKSRTATKADGTVLSTNKETFEGPSSYHAKCNWCRANGYGGVMSWGYYTDVSWDDADLMSLSRHQAKSCWPRTNWSWPTPPQDSDGAYLLDSEADWFWLRDHPDVAARFAADITLAHDPLPIETFSGTIDGAGHTLTISNDVWLAYDSNPALVRTLTGTVKNLTIDLYGRVVSRASRWNDTTVNTSANTLASGTHTAAVLAANLGAGGVIDGVELFIRPGAEVQGPQRVAGLAASVWVADGSHAEIRNSSVHVDGVVRSLARNTAEGDITVQNQVAGGLAGWVGCPGARNIVVTNNIVSLASTGRVAVETGSSSSAGGVIGDLNNRNPLVQGNAVYVASGATVSANESAGVGNVRTSYANASYSISSSENAGRTTFFIEDGAATLADSIGGKSDATVEVSSYDGGAAADGISVDAVAGFWYSVIYGDELVPGGIGGATGETAPVKAAASGPLTLDAPKDGAKRFYRVKVAPVAE